MASTLRNARYREAVERNLWRLEDRMRRNPAGHPQRQYIGANLYDAAERIGIRTADIDPAPRIGSWGEGIRNRLIKLIA